MKKAKWVLALSVLMVLAFSQTTECMAFFQSGNDLVDLMREADKAMARAGGTDYAQAGKYIFFVIGVCDATGFLYDLPPGTTQGQVAAVVSKYLKAHPEEWAEPGALLVIKALRLAFPRKTQ